MAEKLVSPGVFTRENDLSFIAQGVGAIGGAIVGPFKQGPAFKPTIITSPSELEEIFGAADGTYYTELTAQNYLRETGLVTICRVAGVGGYTETAPIILTATSGAVSASIGILFNASSASNAGFSGTVLTTDNDGDFFISGSIIGQYSASVDPADNTDIEDVFGSSPFGSKKAYVYGLFKNHGITFDANTTVTASVIANQDFTNDATYASTPWIQSQLIGDSRFNLVKFHTLADGNVENTRFKIEMELNSVEAIKNAVQSGLGAAFVSVSAIAKELELGVLQWVKIEDIIIKRTLSIIVNPKKYRSKASEIFSKEILTLFVSPYADD